VTWSDNVWAELSQLHILCIRVRFTFLTSQIERFASGLWIAILSTTPLDVCNSAQVIKIHCVRIGDCTRIGSRLEDLWVWSVYPRYYSHLEYDLHEWSPPPLLPASVVCDCIVFLFQIAGWKLRVEHGCLVIAKYRGCFLDTKSDHSQLVSYVQSCFNGNAQSY